MSEPQQPPAQPYGTPPQYANSPYAGSPYPAQQPYPPQQHPTRRPASGDPGLGRIAFILAVISLGIGLLVTISYPLMYRMMGDPTAIGAFGAIGNGLVLILAAVGLILGLMSVRRPGSQILAGIAIGVTASQLVGIVVSWVSNLFYTFSF